MKENALDNQDIKSPDINNQLDSMNLILNLEGFEGPIDLLLKLAREQKVDLIHISILQLSEQYLSFVERIKMQDLELAADYLVMAAWLAYIKSRLLLPSKESEDYTAEEMADALRWQLLRLQAMQERGKEIMEMPRKNKDFFVRKNFGGLKVIYKTIYDVTLYDVLHAYGQTYRDDKPITLEIEPYDLYSVDDALERLKILLPKMPDWNVLMSFLPESILSPVKRRSAISSTLLAVLELVYKGKAKIRQDGGAFSPILVKSSDRSGSL